MLRERLVAELSNNLESEYFGDEEWKYLAIVDDMDSQYL